MVAERHVLLLATPASAQLASPQGPRGDENITNSGGPGAGEGKRRGHTTPAIEFQSRKPPLRLTQEERQAVADAMTRQHTYQRAPKDFQPRIGMTVEKAIKLTAMPRPLIYEVPRLRQYSYAKLESNVLIIDPMSMKVVDIIPRKYPVVARPITPMEWWSTRGRALVGLPPLPPSTTTGVETTGSAAQPSASGTPARMQQAVPMDSGATRSQPANQPQRGSSMQRGSSTMQ